MGDQKLPHDIITGLSERPTFASRPGLHLPALIAAGLGLLLSLIAAAAVGRWEQRTAKVAFDSVASTELIVLQNGVNEYLSRLVTLRTLFESANEEITRSEFEVFSGHLFKDHSGVIRLGWVPRIKRKERADHEQAATDDGVVGYQIKSLANPDRGVFTAPPSDEYFPIFYSTEPKTSMVYGLDYSTDAARWALLQRARDTDAVTAVPTKLFFDLKGGTHGVLVSVPVYVKGTSRTTVADRRRNLSGYVIGIFDLAELLQAIRTVTAASPDIAIRVYPPDMGRNGGPERHSVPDYSSGPKASLSMRAVAAKTEWSDALKIGDTNWRVDANPTSGGRLTPHYDRAMTALATGLIISVFVVIYLVLASRNARQIELANQRVLDLARLDTLTGLPNRAVFLEQLATAADAQDGLGGNTFSVIMLDLDRFKNVNDSLGHAAGDALLQEVADRLRSTLRDTDILARLGGDEFAIIQTSSADQKMDSINLAAQVCKCIAEPFQLPGHHIEVGISIGIAMAPVHGDDPQELLKKADLALYRSKSAGRNCFTLYDDAMSLELEARNTLESDLREAIARDQLELHYQPVFDLKNSDRHDLEALVRWRHPEKGLIPPDQFIPLAEETGLIVPLGEWVLRRACKDATSWPSDVKVAVNLSAVQFKQAELFDVIMSVLAEAGLPPQRLELEITESVLLERQVENYAFMQRLKRAGISFALDDFGTGHSSLSCLTAFPFDKIKIDKSFVGSLMGNYKSSAIISSIVTLARGLDISVTAEGVETAEQFDMLRALGVNFAQGYLLGRPVPKSELASQLERTAHTRMRPGRQKEPQSRLLPFLFSRLKAISETSALASRLFTDAPDAGQNSPTGWSGREGRSLEMKDAAPPLVPEPEPEPRDRSLTGTAQHHEWSACVEK
jgi:diguanylate cyclase (GGDEF)-like protein